MKRRWYLALIVPLLAGCFGSAPPVPRDHYYRLLVSGPATGASQLLLPGVTTVEVLQADGLLRERPLLFSESGQSHEVQQHDYHYWTDAPPRMLQDQMVAYLRHSGISDAVVTPDLRIRPDYQVSGRVKRLERLLGGGPPRVFVEVELSLVRLSDSALFVVDSYAEEEPTVDESVEAAIVALNRATQRVFRRFLDQVQVVAGQSNEAQQAGRSD